MLDHNQSLLTCRARLLGLVVATTGSATLARTATGYTRASGSFLADGFAIGLEVVSTGFPTNAAATIIGLTATTMTVSTTLTVAAAASDRSIVAGLPAERGYTNVAIGPTLADPYIEEAYLFGPAYQPGVGPFSHIIAEPMYVVRFYAADGVDSTALTAYATACLRRFAPTFSMTLASGDVLRVRSDPAPFAGQVLPHPEKANIAWIAVSIPLRAYSANSI